MFGVFKKKPKWHITTGLRASKWVMGTKGPIATHYRVVVKIVAPDSTFTTEEHEINRDLKLKDAIAIAEKVAKIVEELGQDLGGSYYSDTMRDSLVHILSEWKDSRPI